jgi:hypothetical protein
MRVISFALAYVVAAILGSASLPAQPPKATANAEIEGVLHARQEAWNRGDINELTESEP